MSELTLPLSPLHRLLCVNEKLLLDFRFVLTICEWSGSKAGDGRIYCRLNSASRFVCNIWGCSLGFSAGVLRYLYVTGADDNSLAADASGIPYQKQMLECCCISAGEYNKVK
jgi:hypothetical protein